MDFYLSTVGPEMPKQGGGGEPEGGSGKGMDIRWYSCYEMIFWNITHSIRYASRVSSAS